jgi:hypothetical protein
MGTHYHLIVQTPRVNLAAGMQMLNGRYAQRFNWRYRRRGHLFGGRFMSVHIQDETHLMAAHRYVARNPVRAGLCAAPADWRWSSYRALVGTELPPIFWTSAARSRHSEPREGRRSRVRQHRFRLRRLRSTSSRTKLAETDGV